MYPSATIRKGRCMASTVVEQNKLTTNKKSQTTRVHILHHPLGMLESINTTTTAKTTS